MRNILILTLDFPPAFIGGISAWSSDLAQALHHAGRPTTVIAKRSGKTDEYDREQPFEIVRAWGRSWSRWQAVWMRMSAARRIRPNTLVLSATWMLATEILSNIRKNNAELAVAFHGSELTTLTHAPASLQKVVAAAHTLLPVSAFLENELVRLGCIEPGDPRVRVLPMPLDVAPDLQNEDGL